MELFGPKAGVRLPSGAPFKPRSRRGFWLLALLALRPNKSVARDWAAAILWPDSETARETLRRTLTDLRAGLGACSAVLEASGQTLLLHVPESAVDIHRFDALLKRGAAEDLEQAIALYRGPLLEECPESWILADRNRYADAYRGALERLAALYDARGRYGDAVRLLRLALTADPLRESACRALMETLAAHGEPAEAIVVYRDFRRRLHDDVRVEPSPETTAVYRAIVSAAKSAGAPMGVPSAPPAASGPSLSATNLPYP